MFSRGTCTIDTPNNAAYKAVKKETEQDESIEGDYANVSRAFVRYATPSPALSRCAYIATCLLALYHIIIHIMIKYSDYRETETIATPTNAAYKTVEAHESTTEDFYMNMAKTTTTPRGTPSPTGTTPRGTQSPTGTTPRGTPSPTGDELQSSCMYVTY